MVSKKWKNGLLSSSLPLEYQAARLLAHRGFWVDPDYAYTREGSGVVNEFSVDIYAFDFYPFTDPDRVESQLVLLVECKHRNPKRNWLFLRDPHPGESPLGSNTAVTLFDVFSPWRVSRKPLQSFNKLLALAYKGVEVDIDSGDVFDAELRRGLLQLQFALPRAVASCTRDALLGHLDDNKPFFISAILLTNARLLLARKTMSIDSVQDAQSLDELASDVPFVRVHLPQGPELKEHCKREFSLLRGLENTPQVAALEEAVKARGKNTVQNPATALYFLRAGDLWPAGAGVLEQAVVCNLAAFDDLMTALRRAISSSMRHRIHIALEAA